MKTFTFDVGREASLSQILICDTKFTIYLEFVLKYRQAHFVSY